MNVLQSMKTVAALVFRDRSLTEEITYQRLVGMDFDPAGQSTTATTQDMVIRVLSRNKSARTGPGGRASGDLAFLLRAEDLPAEPAPGDRIVRGDEAFLVVRSEKDPSGLLYLVSVQET